MMLLHLLKISSRKTIFFLHKSLKLSKLIFYQSLNINAFLAHFMYNGIYERGFIMAKLTYMDKKEIKDYMTKNVMDIVECVEREHLESLLK